VKYVQTHKKGINLLHVMKDTLIVINTLIFMYIYDGPNFPPAKVLTPTLHVRSMYIGVNIVYEEEIPA
jgi:hypothetical protein